MWQRFFPRRWSQWLGAGAGFLSLAVALALIIAASGIYNVSADVPHLRPVLAFLQLTKNRSVAAHAADVGAPPPIGPAALTARGAAHYARVCSSCHGAPGEPQSPTVQQMLPEPPDLAQLVARRTPEELFWVVQNGLKFSGMPGWPVPEREDEVWAMVSFLEKLPGMSASEYRALAGIDVVRSRGAEATVRTASHDVAGLVSAPTDDRPERLGDCAQCHGVDGLGRGDGAFPILGLQTEHYLLQSLQAFATGERASGIMGSVVATLSPDEMAELAAYYSRTKVPDTPTDGDAATALIERGRQIAHEGIAESSVAACTSCHGVLAGEDYDDQVYPQLAGQYADYTATQLLAWRNGGRGMVRHGDSMVHIAHDLPDDAILALAAYYASLAPDSHS
jgi:cytochrome c553